MNKYKILLLEDDNLLAQTLQELLEEDGYLVDLALDGDEASELSYANRYDLYVFDINVPKIDGFELLGALREAKDRTPTIFISAMVDIKTITKGFNLGADDYNKKPFFPEELLLRIHAKLARTNAGFTCKDLTYDPDTRELFKNNTRIHLSHMLSDMFHLLIMSRGNVVDKDELYECMENPSSTALRVAITKLKQQTGMDIQNIRGVGYSIESC